jgi:signal transduction histidine kinase
VESGSGLGLSIVQRIAEIYGATVTFDNSPGGRGLCVTVRFPAADA